MLIWSILTIRRFLKDRNIDGKEINIKMLVLHSAAFGLFLISVVVYGAVNLVYSAA